jgi:alpha-L-fucosidase 2
LVQSHEEGIIRILPALPPNWEKGFVKGLKARGNIEVDMEWEATQLKSLQLKAKYDTETQINYKEKQITVYLKAGIPYQLTI